MEASKRNVEDIESTIAEVKQENVLEG
jgi:hypothetical protein